MSSSSNSSNICRYFSNGVCSKGSSCRYSHDEAKRSEDVCRFYQVGKCSYGGTCKFHHIKPKTNQPSTSSKPVQNTRICKPPPSLAALGLNVSAPEFVPSWKKPAVTSYATAVKAAEPIDEHAQLAARALCPYYETSGECSQIEKCVFVHGDLCDMCNTYALHPFSEEKRADHVKECTTGHERAMEQAFIEQRSQEKTCGICMENILEKNLRFGILNNCQHCFCLDCIRQWRTKHESADFDSKVVRSCPECRQHSDYVVPSVLWVEDKQEKECLIEMYKENMKAKVCKYYNEGSSRGNCPFGNKCFYKHQLPDGSIDPGESPHVRRRPQIADWLASDDDEDDDEDFSPNETAYRFYARFGMDMFNFDS